MTVIFIFFLILSKALDALTLWIKLVKVCLQMFIRLTPPTGDEISWIHLSSCHCVLNGNQSGDVMVRAELITECLQLHDINLGKRSWRE